MRGKGWRRLKELAGVLGPFGMRRDSPIDAMREVDQAMEDFERDAREIIFRGLVHQLGHEFEIRYFNVPEFHARVDLLLQMVTGILFETTPLTMSERDVRIGVLDTLPLAEDLDHLLHRT